jgi:hypothetical protein
MCIVKKDGRQVRQEDRMDDAVHLVQVAFEKGDRVVVIDEDGYQHNYTRKFERKVADRLNW